MFSKWEQMLTQSQNHYLNFFNNTHDQTTRANGLGTDYEIVWCVVNEVDKKTAIAAKAISGNMIHTTYLNWK